MGGLNIPTDPQWQWAYDAILYTSGEEWPQANEVDLRAMAEELVQFAYDITSASGGVGGLGTHALNNWTGDNANQFQESSKHITDGLPDAVTTANQLAAGVTDFALDTEHTKYTIIIAMVTIVIDIFMALASGFPYLVPGEIAIGGSIVRALIRAFRIRGITRTADHLPTPPHTVKTPKGKTPKKTDHLPLPARVITEIIDEAAEEGAENLGAQLIQTGQGNRHDIDTKAIGIDMAFGAAAGAVGSGLHAAARKHTPNFANSATGQGLIGAASELPVEATAAAILGGGFNPLATTTSSMITAAATTWAHDTGHAIAQNHNPTPDHTGNTDHQAYTANLAAASDTTPLPGDSPASPTGGGDSIGSGSAGSSGSTGSNGGGGGTGGKGSTGNAAGGASGGGNGAADRGGSASSAAVAAGSGPGIGGGEVSADGTFGTAPGEFGESDVSSAFGESDGSTMSDPAGSGLPGFATESAVPDLDVTGAPASGPAPAPASSPAPGGTPSTAPTVSSGAATGSTSTSTPPSASSGPATSAAARTAGPTGAGVAAPSPVGASASNFGSASTPVGAPVGNSGGTSTADDHDPTPAVPREQPVAAHPAGPSTGTLGSDPIAANTSPASDPPASDATSQQVAEAYPWLTSVNPYRAERPEDDSFRLNCVIASIATDLSLAEGVGHQAGGVDVPARTDVPGGLPERHLAAYQAQRLGLPEGQSRTHRFGTLDDVRGVMRAAPKGSRGIVIVRGENPETPSHVLNVVHDGNGVNFLDGQRGGLARRPESVTEVDFLPLAHDIHVPAGHPLVDLSPESRAGGAGRSATAPIEIQVAVEHTNPPAGAQGAGDSLPADERPTPFAVVQVRRDGLCLPTAVVATDPVTILNRLRAGDDPIADDQDIANWLNDPSSVRRDAAGGPPTPHLTRVVGALRSRVEQHLVATHGQTLPEEVVGRFRASRDAALVRDWSDDPDAAMRSALRDGPDQITEAEFADQEFLETAFVTEQARMVTGNTAPTQEQVARAWQDFYERRPSPSAQLAFLTGRQVMLPLSSLSDTQLARYAAHRYGRRRGSLDDVEFANVLAEVRRWAWASAAGKLFPALLSDTLDVGIDVIDAGTGTYAVRLGRTNRRIALVHENGNHYNATAPPYREQPVPQGRDALYHALVAGDPVLAHKLLWPGGTAPDHQSELAEWLADQDAVNDELKELADGNAERGAEVSMLSRAAEALRDLALANLEALPDTGILELAGLPAEADDFVVLHRYLRIRIGRMTAQDPELDSGLAAEDILQADRDLMYDGHRLRAALAADHRAAFAKVLTSPPDHDETPRVVGAALGAPITVFHRAENREERHGDSPMTPFPVLRNSDGRYSGAPATVPVARIADATTSLDHAYGGLAGPKRIKPGERDDRGALRLNPFWYRLEDAPRDLLRRRGAHWHYLVNQAGDILLGTEEIGTVLTEREWADLATAMNRADPEMTVDRLKQLLDHQGHPTIAAGFDEAGRTVQRPARVSGELVFNADAARWEVNDRSGRYMRPKIRKSTDPSATVDWAARVAKRLSDHFGEPINAVHFSKDKIKTQTPEVRVPTTADDPMPDRRAGGLRLAALNSVLLTVPDHLRAELWDKALTTTRDALTAAGREPIWISTKDVALPPSTRTLAGSLFPGVPVVPSTVAGATHDAITYHDPGPGLEFLHGINPWHDIGGDFTTNCVLAAIATDLTLETEGTHTFQVPPSEPLTLQHLLDYANDPARTAATHPIPFTTTTARDLTTALADSPTWQRGFVVVPGHPDHVLNAVTLPTGLALIDGQTNKRATLKPETLIHFLPLTDQIPTFTSRTDENPAGRKAGAAGFEVETHTVMVPPPHLTKDQIWALGDLAVSPYARIVADRLRKQWIFEVVTLPAAVTEREAADRVSTDEAIADARRAVQALREAPGRTLEAALAGTRFTVTPAGAGIGVGHQAVLADIPAEAVHPHFTVGLPLTGLFSYLIDQQPPLTDEVPPGSGRWFGRRHHEEALVFASDMLARHRRIPRDDPSLDRDVLHDLRDENISPLLGFLALSYMQVAAVISGSVRRGVILKNHATMASRTALYAVREALPQDVRDWVEAQWRLLRDAAVTAHLRGAGRPAPPPAVLDVLEREITSEDGSGTYLVGEYLESTFRGDAPRSIDQRQALEVRTHMTSLDDNGGQLPTPLVVLELRDHIDGFPTFDEVADTFRDIVDDLRDRMSSPPPDATPEQAVIAYPWLAGVNPHRVEDPADNAFNLNCVITTIATDLALAEGVGHQAGGVDVPLGPADPRGLPETDLGRYQAQRLGQPGPQGPVHRFDTLDAVREVMAAAPLQSRAIVLVRHPSPAIAHSFNVIHDEYGVNFLDGQHGGLADPPEAGIEIAFLPLTHDIHIPERHPAITLSADRRVGSLDDDELAGAADHAATAEDSEDDAELPSFGPEIRFGALAGPAHVLPEERDRSGELRVNALFYRLADAPAQLLDDKAVTWEFSVTDDGDVRLGHDHPLSALNDGERSRLIAGIAGKETELSESQIEDLLDAKSGHPTVSVGFDESGRTSARPARISGELTFSATRRRWEVNPASGRHMQPAIRVTDVRETEWTLANVAEAMSDHLNVPIGVMPVGEWEAAPPEPQDAAGRQMRHRLRRAILQPYLPLDQETEDEFTAHIDSLLEDGELSMADVLLRTIAFADESEMIPHGTQDPAIELDLAVRVAMAEAYLEVAPVNDVRDSYREQMTTFPERQIELFSIAAAYAQADMADVAEKMFALDREEEELVRAAASVADQYLRELPNAPATGFITVSDGLRRMIAPAVDGGSSRRTIGLPFPLVTHRDEVSSTDGDLLSIRSASAVDGEAVAAWGSVILRAGTRLRISSHVRDGRTIYEAEEVDLPSEGEPVPSGLILVGDGADDRAHRDAAAAFPPAADRYLLFAHGRNGAVLFDGEEISPERLADIIIADPHWRLRPIVLIVCGTGVDDGFAARLSRALPPGTPVTAPTGTAWITPSGQAFVAGQTFDAEGRPWPATHAAGDIWRRFVTDGAAATTVEDATGDLDRAPARTESTWTVGNQPRAWATGPAWPVADGPAWLAKVNPLRDNAGDFLTNCVLAAIGTDMSLQTGGALFFQVPPTQPHDLTDLVNYANDPERNDGNPPATPFHFVHTTTGHLHQELATAPEGARGIIAIPGHPGHVVNAVRLHDGPAYLDGQLGRRVHIPADMDVLFLPLTDEFTVDGPVVDEATLTVREAGAAGYEIETRTLLIPPAGLTRDEVWRIGDLAFSPNAKIVIDDTQDGWIFEVVTAPAAVSARETVGRVAVEDAIRDARIAVNALRFGEGTSLADALRGTNFTVTDEGRAISVGGLRPSREGRTVSPHYTTGVPLNGLFRFLMEQTRRFPRGPQARVEALARLMHVEALEFAAWTVASYLGVSHQDPAMSAEALAANRDPDVSALAGFTALAYIQVAAVLTGKDQPARALPKNFATVASRTAMHAVRGGLPAGVRAWTESQHSSLSGAIITSYLGARGYPTEAKDLRQIRRTRVHMADDSGTYRIEEYLESIFRADPPRPIDQNQALEVRTHMTALDDGGGMLRDTPLVVLELRHHHHDWPTLIEVENEFRTIVGDLDDLMTQARQDVSAGIVLSDPETDDSLLQAARATPRRSTTGAIEIPAGIALLGNDSSQGSAQAAEAFPVQPDTYVVFGHGVDGRLVVDDREVTAEDLAALIASDPRSSGRTIVLMVCGTAADDNDGDAFAARLARALPPDNRVIAPNGTAWSTPDGLAFVTEPVFDEQGRPSLRPATDGFGWRSYTGTASAETLGSDLPSAVPRGDGNATAAFAWGTEIYRDQVARFERRLGTWLAQRPGVRHAAREALSRHHSPPADAGVAEMITAFRDAALPAGARDLDSAHTMARLIAAFDRLGVPGVARHDFVLAVMAWALARPGHSLRDLLRGAAMVHAGPAIAAGRPDEDLQHALTAFGLTLAQIRGLTPLGPDEIADTVGAQPAPIAVLPKMLPREAAYVRTALGVFDDDAPGFLGMPRDMIERAVGFCHDLATGTDEINDWFAANPGTREALTRNFTFAHVLALLMYTSKNHELLNWMSPRPGVPRAVSAWYVRRWVARQTNSAVKKILAGRAADLPPVLFTDRRVAAVIDDLTHAVSGGNRNAIAASRKKVSEETTRLARELPRQLTVHLDMIMDALRLLPPATAKTFRGDWVARLFSRFDRRTVTTTALTSTSTRESEARKYSDKVERNQPSILLTMDLAGHAGRDISLISDQDEGEVLLLPGARFRVESTGGTRSSRTATLKEEAATGAVMETAVFIADRATTNAANLSHALSSAVASLTELEKLAEAPARTAEFALAGLPQRLAQAKEQATMIAGETADLAERLTQARQDLKSARRHFRAEATPLDQRARRMLLSVSRAAQSLSEVAAAITAVPDVAAADLYATIKDATARVTEATAAAGTTVRSLIEAADTTRTGDAGAMRGLDLLQNTLDAHVVHAEHHRARAFTAWARLSAVEAVAASTVQRAEAWLAEMRTMAESMRPTIERAEEACRQAATLGGRAATERAIERASAARHEVDAGIALIGPDPDNAAALEAARAFPPVPGSYVVFVHSLNGRPTVDGTEISPRTIAAIIARDPSWRGRPVVLMSCGTAADDGFARRLARALPPGTRVTAPTGTAWTTPDGQAFVTEAAFDEAGRPEIRPTHGAHRWRTFQVVDADVAAVDHGADLGGARPRGDSAGPEPYGWGSDGRLFAAPPIIHLQPGLYHQQAEIFEQNLGVELFKQPRVRHAALAAVARLRKVLGSRRTDVAGEALRAFVKDDPTSAGQVGTRLDNAQINDMLTTGNLRELMTAFYNAAYYNGSSAAPTLKSVVQKALSAGDLAEPARLGLDTEALGVVLAEYGSWRRTLARALTGLRGQGHTFDADPLALGVLAANSDWVAGNLATGLSQHGKTMREGADSTDRRRGLPAKLTAADLARLGIGLSAREAAHLRADKVRFGAAGQKAHLSWNRRPVTERGPELPLPWVTGKAYWELDQGSWWYDATHRAAGIPVMAGVSGTTVRMLAAFDWLRVPGVSRTDFLLAIMAWMLTSQDHSLYEIMRGAEIMKVGPPVSAMTSADEVYRSLTAFGITRSQIRDLSTVGDSVAEDLSPWTVFQGIDRPGMLPHQAAYALTALGGLNDTGPYFSGITADVLERCAEIHNDLLAGGPAGQRWFAANPGTREIIGRTFTFSHLLALAAYTGNGHQMINLMAPGTGLPRAVAASLLAAQVRGDVDDDIQRVLAGRESDLPARLAKDRDTVVLLDKLRAAVQNDDQAEIASTSAQLRDHAAVLGRDLPRQMEAHLDMAVEALQLLPPVNATAYRGDWAAPLLSRYLRKTFTTSGITSTTRSKMMAAEFTERHRVKTPAVIDMTLTGHAGRDISFVSGSPEETEVALLPGATFDVTGYLPHAALLRPVAVERPAVGPSAWTGSRTAAVFAGMAEDLRRTVVEAAGRVTDLDRRFGGLAPTPSDKDADSRRARDAMAGAVASAGQAAADAEATMAAISRLIGKALAAGPALPGSSLARLYELEAKLEFATGLALEAQDQARRAWSDMQRHRGHRQQRRHHR